MFSSFKSQTVEKQIQFDEMVLCSCSLWKVWSTFGTLLSPSCQI